MIDTNGSFVREDHVIRWNIKCIKFSFFIISKVFYYLIALPFFPYIAYDRDHHDHLNSHRRATRGFRVFALGNSDRKNVIFSFRFHFFSFWMISMLVSTFSGAVVVGEGNSVSESSVFVLIDMMRFCSNVHFDAFDSIKHICMIWKRLCLFSLRSSKQIHIEWLIRIHFKLSPVSRESRWRWITHIIHLLIDHIPWS